MGLCQSSLQQEKEQLERELLRQTLNTLQVTVRELTALVAIMQPNLISPTHQRAAAS